jgi:serine/threonine protein kinase
VLFDANPIHTFVHRDRYPPPEQLSPALQELIARMLCTDPNKRADLKEVKSSAWYARLVAWWKGGWELVHGALG